MAGEGPSWPAKVRARAGTVRVRTTVAAVAIVGVAMAVSAVVMVITLRRSMTDHVRTATRLRAADVAAVIAQGGAPGELAVDDAEEVLIQVVDGDRNVVAFSPNVRGLPPVADLRPGETKEIHVSVEDHPFLAVAASAPGGLTVVVARNLEPVTDSTSTVVNVLWVGVPILLALVGATTWKVVGRALAPVEAIRSEVDEISAAELHRRVPDPTGHDEVARLANTMNRMLARLEQSQSRQRRFISDASHELRSPVASIRQHAEVALAHPDQTTTVELAEIVLAEDLRVQALVEDLLFLARADEQTLDLRRGPVDVDDVVFDEAKRLRESSPLRVDTTGVSAGRVSGDAAGLRRMVRNIADNAARHASERIAFWLTEQDGSVTVVVDDDGPGIPAPERERVLERFVRLDDARDRDAGGSGLGLAIVIELAEAHGGTVAITDSPLGGARIAVTLPALPGSA